MQIGNNNYDYVYLKPSNAWQNIERLSDAWKIRWLTDEHINPDLSKNGLLKDSKKITLAKIAQYAVLRLINFLHHSDCKRYFVNLMRASAQFDRASALPLLRM